MRGGSLLSFFLYRVSRVGFFFYGFNDTPDRKLGRLGRKCEGFAAQLKSVFEPNASNHLFLFLRRFTAEGKVPFFLWGIVEHLECRSLRRRRGSAA